MHLYEEYRCISHVFFACVWLLPWTAGSTVRLMASTRPSGQPSRKQSDTSKSNRPGFNTRLVLLPPRSSTFSLVKLGSRHGHKIWLLIIEYTTCIFPSVFTVCCHGLSVEIWVPTLTTSYQEGHCKPQWASQWTGGGHVRTLEKSFI